MILEFLCPNGHKVHCSESRAGQAAKCPRCGVPFRIPTLEELDAAEVAESPTDSSMQVGGDSALGGPASGVALGAASGPDQIEFLCPNDHLLHGRAALQGRPGRCPECGSKFRIPIYADQPTSEPPEPDVEPSDREPEASSVKLGGEDQDSASAGSESSRDALPAVEPDRPPSNAGQSRAAHPAAGLLTRLWRFKSRGATIELRYGDGHRLTPDEFLASLSSTTYGVFAVKEPDGTLTITATPWDSIHTVIARGVQPSDEKGG